jgi:glycerol-3-phosphate cytidylyltransferase
VTTVITYGTFDLFHVGHVRLLRRLRALGDRVIVGCSTDEFNAIKGKESVFSYAERAEILAACAYVDLVIPERNWEQKAEDIRTHGVDIFAMGDDWAGKFDDLGPRTGCTVTYLPRTLDVSSTDIRDLLRRTSEDRLVDLRTFIDQLRRNGE